MRIWAAEFLGTFALVFAGTGAIVSDGISGGAVTHVGVALTFGLVVMAMICAFGDVSGAHLNPAVTLGFVAAGRSRPASLGVYLSAQLAGALASSASLALLFPSHATLGVTEPAGSWLQSFALEIVLSFLLMLVILLVSSGSKERGLTAAAAIGGVVGLEALFAGPISGASMNPVRSLAPALVSGRLEHVWIYVAAPIIGALLAAPCCALVHGPGCCDSRAKEGVSP